MGDPVPSVGGNMAATKAAIATVTGGNPAYGFNSTLANVAATSTPSRLAYGCAPGYLLSMPGFLRILNIVRKTLQ